MKTSYFSKYKGNKGISIACSAPKNFKGQTYQQLVPKWSLVKDYKDGNITKKEYVSKYLKQIDKLDPNKVLKDLKDKVLLCWEGPGKFCHRRIVAWWIENELNIKVPELKGGE